MVRSSYYNYKYGIREKLIFIFILIKIIPLVILAVYAANQVGDLGTIVEKEYAGVVDETQNLLEQVADLSRENSIKALDSKSREAIERLTTDTASAVARFLYQRDEDILYLAKLPKKEDIYKNFIESKKKEVIDHHKWVLSSDKTRWVAENEIEREPLGGIVTPKAKDNKKEFHYRPSVKEGGMSLQPLYHEATFVDLNGKESLKVTNTPKPKKLIDITKKENTYCRAEDYFEELKNLKKGEIYVSEMIGEYLPSKIIGTYTPQKAKDKGIPFEPEKAGYAGKENPVGKRFKGIIRWATPVFKNNVKVGYVTLALDHTHVMEFTDHIVPTERRFSAISDASTGNYAFMWDYKGKNISHPRDYFIPGYNRQTGEPVVPWLSQDLYDQWQESGKDYETFRKGAPSFYNQSLEVKPARELIKEGLIALDCRYLNFAPQCTGWNNLTQYGGSGSFVIFWSKLWKLTTAATIPYYTGRYGETPRGFGFVTIGANVHEFHSAAQDTARKISSLKTEYTKSLKKKELDTLKSIKNLLSTTQKNLSYSTLVMVVVVVFIAVWMASTITSRIVEMIRSIKVFQSGNLDHRIQVRSDDEMGQLGNALNEMSDKLKDSFAQLEKERARAEESDRTKSVFLTNMSHEVRTPLNAIIGMSKIALESLKEEKNIYLVKTVKESADSLLLLINDILDFSKVEAGEFNLEEHVFDLHEFINSTVRSVEGAALQKGLTLTCHISDEVPLYAKGDGLRVKQVFLNVISNGIKFTETGSVKIIVNSEEKEDNRIKLKITVEDTGVGIPAEMLETVFERFSQVDSSTSRVRAGAGLGLAIARKLCQFMGGDISVDCTKDTGSTFVFTLMLEKVDGSDLLIKSGDSSIEKGVKRRVLLVEDNLANRDLARMILENAGHQVGEAANGLEALELLAKESFDLIFMDIQMPRMDGLITTKVIRALEGGKEPGEGFGDEVSSTLSEKLAGKHHPIIALTAHATSGDREKSFAAGMDDHLTKPFMPEQLLNALVQHTVRPFKL